MVTSFAGAFGRVFKGLFKTNQDAEVTPVAVKTIKSKNDYQGCDDYHCKR